MKILNKSLLYFSTILSALLLGACGSSDSSISSESGDGSVPPVFTDFGGSDSATAPTVSDYENLGIEDVDSSNVDTANALVALLAPSTDQEVSSLVDAMFTINSPNDQLVPSDILSVSLSSDGDNNVLSYGLDTDGELDADGNRNAEILVSQTLNSTNGVTRLEISYDPSDPVNGPKFIQDRVLDDDNGILSISTDFNGNGTVDQVENHILDDNNNVLQKTISRAGIVAEIRYIEFNDENQAITVATNTDANINTGITVVHNALGNILGIDTKFSREWNSDNQIEKVSRDLDADGQDDQIEMYSYDDDGNISEIQQRRWLKRALKKLSEVEVAVIKMHYESGYKCKEIAVALNKSENAVKLHLSRARKKLKKYIVER